MMRARKSRKLRAAQSIETRIAELESLHRSRGEILVIWRLPGASMSKALSNVDRGPGDRVVCFEWFGSGAPPQPQWRSDLRGSLSKEERDSIVTMLQRILDASPDREQPAGNPQKSPDRDELARYSDEELLYVLYGVPDGKMIKGSLRG